VQFDY